MSIDYTKLNDQIVRQAYDVSSAFLTEAQKKKLFQNKIDRAAAMIRAQEQFRRMDQEQWNRRGLEKWYLGSLISSSWRFNSVTRNQLCSGTASGKGCHSRITEVETMTELLAYVSSGHRLFQSTDKISVEVNEQG